MGNSLNDKRTAYKFYSGKFMKLNNQTMQSYRYLSKWVTISIISGISGVIVLQTFIFFSSNIDDMIYNISIPIFIWPLLGALVTGAVIYKIEIGAAGEGVPSYIRGILKNGGDLSSKVTFFKYFAVLFTLSTYGNGGIVGPLGRVSAGFSVIIVKLLKRFIHSVDQEDIKTAAICGMAAIVGAIFHSSIGAGIFAVEIIQRKSMNYKDLFPAILSSSTAVFISKTMKYNSFYGLKTADKFMDVHMVGWLVLFALIVGFAGGLYTIIYRKIAILTKRSEGNIILKVMIGSLIAFILAYAVNPGLIGTSKPIFDAVFAGDMSTLTGRLGGFGYTGFVLIIIIFVKILSNCITVGSGMSAGFTGPSALVGMLLGVSASNFLGIEFASPTYFAFMAAGFSGMLASSMNIPLAAAVLSIEVFGLQYSFPASISAIIGFQMMRSSTIYDFALRDKK